MALTTRKVTSQKASTASQRTKLVNRGGKRRAKGRSSRRSSSVEDPIQFQHLWPRSRPIYQMYGKLVKRMWSLSPREQIYLQSWSHHTITSPEHLSAQRYSLSAKAILLKTHGWRHTTRRCSKTPLISKENSPPCQQKASSSSYS